VLVLLHRVPLAKSFYVHLMSKNCPQKRSAYSGHAVRRSSMLAAVQQQQGTANGHQPNISTAATHVALLTTIILFARRVFGSVTANTRFTTSNVMPVCVPAENVATVSCLAAGNRLLLRQHSSCSSSSGRRGAMLRRYAMANVAVESRWTLNKIR
jgi:hypothetical protein